MDEYVLPAFTLDEPVTFCGVKPLDCTLFLHTAFCPCWIGIAICEDGNGGNARRSAVTPLVIRPEDSLVTLRALTRLVGITTTNCKPSLAFLVGVVTTKNSGGVWPSLKTGAPAESPSGCASGSQPGHKQ